MKRPVFRKPKPLTIAASLAVFLIVVGLAYAIFWLVVSFSIRSEVDSFRARMEQKNIDIYGTEVTVGGFPGPHEVSFSGGIRGQGFDIEVPQLTASGFFLAGEEIFLSLPAGLRFVKPEDPHGLRQIEKASVTFILPEYVPEELTEPHLLAWQQAGGRLNVTGFDLQRTDLTLRGKGTAGLDRALQPEGRLSVTVSGHLDFLETLKTAEIIEPNQALFLAAVLAAASTGDPAAQEELTLKTEITVRNRTLMIGAARVGSLPAISWPRPDQGKHSRPGQPQ